MSLIEYLFAISIFVVMITVLLYSFGHFKKEVTFFLKDLEERGRKNEMKMLIEKDLFARRRSGISRVSSGGIKHCMGFWELSEGEEKYVIYHFLSDEDDRTCKEFRRFVINQKTLADPDKGLYAGELIMKIENGTYVRPNHKVYNRDFTRDFTGHVFVENGRFRLEYGDYSYTIP